MKRSSVPCGKLTFALMVTCALICWVVLLSTIDSKTQSTSTSMIYCGLQSSTKARPLRSHISRLALPRHTYYVHVPLLCGPVIPYTCMKSSQKEQPPRPSVKRHMQTTRHDTPPKQQLSTCIIVLVSGLACQALNVLSRNWALDVTRPILAAL